MERIINDAPGTAIRAAAMKVTEHLPAAEAIKAVNRLVKKYPIYERSEQLSDVNSYYHADFVADTQINTPNKQDTPSEGYFDRPKRINKFSANTIEMNALVHERVNEIHSALTNGSNDFGSKVIREAVENAKQVSGALATIQRAVFNLRSK